MVALGGVDAGWNPGGSRIGEKSSLISDDSVGGHVYNNWEKRSDMHAKGICKLTADWSCFRDPSL